MRSCKEFLAVLLVQIYLLDELENALIFIKRVDFNDRAYHFGFESFLLVVHQGVDVQAIRAKWCLSEPAIAFDSILCILCVEWCPGKGMPIEA